MTQHAGHTLVLCFVTKNQSSEVAVSDIIQDTNVGEKGRHTIYGLDLEPVTFSFAIANMIMYSSRPSCCQTSRHVPAAHS